MHLYLQRWRCDAAAVDGKNNARMVGGDDFQVEIVGPGNTTPKPNIVDNNDGCNIYITRRSEGPACMDTITPEKTSTTRHASLALEPSRPPSTKEAAIVRWVQGGKGYQLSNMQLLCWFRTCTMHCVLQGRVTCMV